MKVEPTKGIMKVKIDRQGKVAMIGSLMEEGAKKHIIEFLSNNYDVMTYSQ